ncbi:MAG: sugar phosphate isomerase/epimerase [Ignavibacteriales bacterium]|nr:sugar phosphate isomerase/epimerase [Ignavibacteriales bacterium]
MAILSAFADEVTDDFKGQIDFLASEKVGFIEIRFVNKKNVVDLSQAELLETRELMQDRGIRVSAIASPIGKVRIDEPFRPHLDKFRHAIDAALFFHSPFIRIFSFYPPKGGRIETYRTQVIERMRRMVELLVGTNIVMVHENETDIYGSSAENCVDLVKSVDSPKLRLAYDPANFVWGEKITNNFDVCWHTMKPYVVHVHIKDWKLGNDHAGSMPGEGDGQVRKLLEDLARMKYEGFLTVEPHLKSGGQFGGETGPELFSQAIAATRNLCREVGLPCD